ncbi:MAG: hypothetical protein M0P13_05630 [Fibrobacteraceae bacterium]|nr:hypothetical protein [Fibrobacteraceae bacterium]
MKLKILFLVPFLCLFAACDDGAPQTERIQINKKYPLESWPDSTYIASLDSILKAEPIKKDTDSAETEISVNTRTMPSFSIPNKRTGIPAEEPKSGDKTTPATKASTQTYKQASGNNEEHFADKFMNALGDLQSDPSNTSKYKLAEAKDGEDILKLLSRAYGKDATKLPRFYTLSALQSVNPGVAIEHLKSGDKVRIPVL